MILKLEAFTKALDIKVTMLKDLDMAFKGEVTTEFVLNIMFLIYRLIMRKKIEHHQLEKVVQSSPSDRFYLEEVLRSQFH